GHHARPGLVEVVDTSAFAASGAPVLGDGHEKQVGGRERATADPEGGPEFPAFAGEPELADPGHQDVQICPSTRRKCAPSTAATAAAAADARNLRLVEVA